MEFEPLSRELIGAAIEVHRALGPGLLESVYQRCLAIELGQRGIGYKREVRIPIRYRGRSVGDAYRVDFIVDESIVVEIKSVQRVEDIHRAQLLTYLRLTGLRTGFLLNFNQATLRDGIVRMRL